MRLIKPIQSNGRQFNQVPSLFTLGNALCGLAAIVALFESLSNAGGLPAAALWFIFFAMLFDLLDGLAARLLHAESVHGMNLDSLADVISFGAAPAILIHVSGLDAVIQGLPVLAVYLLSGLYLGCAMWRLAVYNSRPMHGAGEQNRLTFTGLPSPAAAAMVCSMAWLMARPHGPTGNSAVYLAYVLPVALLMISSVSYPHLRNLTERLPVWISVVIGISALSLVVILGMKGLMILSHVYVLSAPVYALASKITQRAASEHAAASRHRGTEADPVRDTETMTD